MKAEDVLTWIDKAWELKAVALGEPISDEYLYIKPLGKSPKDSLVTFQHEGSETFEGGITAMGRHLAEVCGEVKVETGGMKPVRKARYVLRPFTQKVFSETWPAETDGVVIDLTVLKKANLVVCCDYGHGLIPNTTWARLVCGASRFLALTVQANSINWGFNLVTKWPQADYVVLDEMELRLATADRDGQLEPLVRTMAHRLETRCFAVTLGHEGCLMYDGNQFIRSPAVAEKVVDRMGAGDAFLAVTASLVYLGAPADVVAFVGNVAGAIKVGIRGHSEPVRKETLKRWVRRLL